MNPPPRPTQERRRYRRLTAENIRVRCVSGDFADHNKDVNFARRLINISLGGLCIETTGRLRSGVRMSAEVRFDDFGGALRSQAQIIWAETVTQGASETHLAGLRFIGPELTAPVREFLEGGRATLIVSKRRAEYEDLKQKAEGRKDDDGPKPWGWGKRFAVLLLILLLGYAGSFGAFVGACRRDPAAAGIHFRYLGAESKGGPGEERLATFYDPLYRILRKAGIDLTYDRP